MDFSEKYAKMCEKAKEIQEMWEPQIGDFFVAKRKYVEIQGDDYPEVIVEKGEVNVVHRAYRIEDYYPNSEGFKEVGVWLPRQDQLQEMLIGSFRKIPGRIEQTSIYEITWRFYHFIGDMGMYRGIYKRDPQYLFNTAEQLWLAFVMWEKYDKVWDDQREEWIKEV